MNKKKLLLKQSAAAIISDSEECELPWFLTFCRESTKMQEGVLAWRVWIGRRVWTQRRVNVTEVEDVDTCCLTSRTGTEKPFFLMQPSGMMRCRILSWKQVCAHLKISEISERDEEQWLTSNACVWHLYYFCFCCFLVLSLVYGKHNDNEAIKTQNIHCLQNNYIMILIVFSFF